MAKKASSASKVLPTKNALIKTVIGISVGLFVYEMATRPIARQVLPTNLSNRLT